MASTVQPSAQLLAYYNAAAAATGVPAALLIAQGRQESGFQTSVVSPSGAEGIAQFMPSTAAGLGINPLDPAQAIMGQARLMATYLSQYKGSISDALAAYNAGPGAVAQYGGVPPYAETQSYVAKITADYAASAGTASTSSASSGNGIELAGVDLNPLNWGSDITGAVSSAVSSAFDSALSTLTNALKPVVITGVLLLGGVGLVVAGVWKSASGAGQVLDQALDPAGGA
jgi:hypothetical protein